MPLSPGRDRSDGMDRTMMDDHHHNQNQQSPPRQHNLQKQQQHPDPSVRESTTDKTVQRIHQHPHQLHQQPTGSSNQGSTCTSASSNVSVTAVVHDAPNNLNPEVLISGANKNISESVVPDLMNIYEQMSKSSTPHQQAQQQAQQQQHPPQLNFNPHQHPYHQHTQPPPSSSTPYILPPSYDGTQPQQAWVLGGGPQQNYVISNFPIPPIPPSAYAVMDGASAVVVGPPSSLDKEPAGSNPTQQQQQRPATTTPPPPPTTAPPPPLPPPPGRSSRRGSATSSKRQVNKDETSSVGSTSSGGVGRGGGGGGDASEATKGGGNNTKRRKSNKESDGRWSKRFTWPEDLHRDFVSAIFEVGLKHSSPSTILEYMAPNEKINSERIKSHLQKYRLHRSKAKEEFMNTYDTTLKKMHENPQGFEHLQPLAGGEIAAQLTYMTMTDPHDNDYSAGQKNATEDTSFAKPMSRSRSLGQQNQQQQQQPQPYVQPQQQPSPVQPPREGTLILPRLTEEEKLSPIGTSMGYLMGLFFSLTQQLMTQRAVKAQEAAAAAALKDQQVVVPYESSAALDTSAAATAVTSSTAPAAGVVATASPSTRTRREENCIMKREMQSQMAFQNKMRALKQEELKKWRGARETSDDNNNSNTSSEQQQQQPPQHHHQQQQQQQYQQYHHQHIQQQHTPLHQLYSPSDFQQQPPPQTQQHHSMPPAEAAAPSAYEQHQQHQHPGKIPPGVAVTAAAVGESSPLAATNSNSNPNYHEFHHQGAGEMNQGGNDTGERERQRGLSLGAETDFWNSDVLDEQLFEFLMDNQ